MYFQPIKNDDPQLDFYTMYKRETTEHDTEYMNKYNEDLNTTLIFVSVCVLRVGGGVDRVSRLVCSQQSAPPLSSPSSQNSSQTLVNGPKLIFEQSSSASTRPSLQAKSQLLLQCGVVPLKRSLRPRISFTQAC